MKWIKDLYISPAMEKKKIKIKWKLNHGAGVVGVYLLVMPLDNSHLEIINSAYLKQKYYRRRKMVIIGIAESIESAYDILIKIVSETFEHTKDADIKKYLLERYPNMYYDN